MESAFELVVIEALDALDTGEDIGTILERYPQYRAELEPILLTSTNLANMRVAHSLEAEAASRQRFLEYAAVTADPVKTFPLLLLLRRFSLAMAALLVALTLLSSGILFASSEAVPGDVLYDAKRFFEDTRYSLTADMEKREELQEQFQQARIREIETLLRMERSEEVEFAGIIEAIDGNVWVVAGLEVVIMDTTTLSGAEDLAVGYLVQVAGMTTDGRVQARTVVIQSVDSSPEPESVPTETPTVEPTPTSTPTPTPTATQTPAPTASTEELGPEQFPTIELTSTSGSNDNDNDDDDGDDPGGNDNGNAGESNGNENGSGNGGNQNSGGNSNHDDDDENENHGNDNDNDDDEDDEDNENDDDNENEANENKNDNERKD
jgi:hypothetical protein